MTATAQLLNVQDLQVSFPVRRGLLGAPTAFLKAVNGVTFSVARGESFAIVGESGSGKTTLGRTILRLQEATSGLVEFDGHDITRLTRRQLKPFRRRMQIVFQDPFSSLNPRMRVGDILGEPLDIHRLVRSTSERNDQISELLQMVGLSPSHAGRYPHEFSGGQRQRIGIARALSLKPDFIVADEPLSSLDVSIQAQIIELIDDLRQRLGLTIVTIAHDLAAVQQLSDRVAVMYLGRIVEMGPTRQVFSSPRHPYTEALLSAVPMLDLDAIRKKRIVLRGEIPNPITPPSGCVFRTRCPLASSACEEQRPPLLAGRGTHAVACFHPIAD